MENKSIWQGREHLKNQYDDMVQGDEVSNDGLKTGHGSAVLKKELWFILVLTSFMALILIGLMIYDQQSNGLNELASYLMSFTK